MNMLLDQIPLICDGTKLTLQDYSKERDINFVPDFVVNEMVIPPTSKAGYDSRVVFRGDDRRTITVYQQGKIAQSPKNKSEFVDIEVLAAALVHICKEHDSIAAANSGFDEVHIVFYCWGVTRDANLNAKKIIKAISSKASEADKARVIQFVNKHLNNIHIMIRSDIEDWLIPTFTVIPRLFEKCEGAAVK